MTIEELRAKLADLHKQMNAVDEAAAGEERDLTEDETTRLAELQTEFDATKTALARAEKRQDRETYMNTSRGRQTAPAEPVGPAAAGSDVTDVHDRREDDLQGGFASAGEFYQAAYNLFVPGGHAADDRLIVDAPSGMNQAIGSEGGILVPPAFSTKIWDGMSADSDNLLDRTDSYPVEGESLTFPANAETSRATGSRFGGVQGYWLAEAAQMTGSKPTLRQMKLEPKEMGVLVYVTDKLLRNGPAAEQYLTRAATEEMLFMTGDAIINGNGTGKPLGVLNSDCTIEVGAEDGQAADTVVTENIVKMWGRMHARARQGAVWFLNQEVETQLLTMTISVGTGGVPAFMPAGGVSGLPYSTLFARPIIPIEYCAQLGDAGDIILANLGFYATGIQGGVRSAMSIHLRFDYNESAFRFLFAVDGQSWLASAITPYKATSGQTLSPFVTLAARD